MTAKPMNAPLERLYHGDHEYLPASKVVAQVEDLNRQILALIRERDEALAYVKDATVAITELTSGGSEFFGKRIAGIYTADLPFCVQRIRETRDGLFEQVRQSKREQKAAEAALSAAQEEVGRLQRWLSYVERELAAAMERGQLHHSLHVLVTGTQELHHG